MVYPLRVEVNEQNIAKITATFKASYEEIINEIQGATNFGVANRKAILSQIDNILEDLAKVASSEIEKDIPKYYQQGANEAVAQLKNANAPIDIKTGFNQIHKQAIFALVDDTSTAFGESLSGVSRTANALLGRAVREGITQKIAKGAIAGDALREVKQQIKGVLAEDGLTALVDRGGKKWDLDRYAEMLFRTKMVEARNRGLANRMVENGYDLVQVSAHGATDVCGDWEGKILSLTGDTDGYDTVADAEADGLFHPNCKHAINALIPSLARETKAYYPDEETRLISEEEIARLSGLE
jgi:Phage minor capsid protein 2.